MSTSSSSYASHAPKHRTYASVYGVAGLQGRLEGVRPQRTCPFGIPEVPGGQTGSHEADGLYALAEVVEVTECVLGAEAGEGRRQVMLGASQVAEPEATDAADVVPFGAYDVVVAGQVEQLPADLVGLAEAEADERRVGAQAERRRLGRQVVCLAQRSDSFVQLVQAHLVTLPGKDRHHEPVEDRQLLDRPLATLRTALEDRQHPIGEVLDLVMRVDASRQRQRPLVVLDGRDNVARQLVVGGDLAGELVTSTVDREQGVGGTPMELAPPSGTDCGVGDVPDAIVAEVVCVGPTDPHDAPAPELVEPVGQFVASLSQHVTEVHVVERATDDGRGADYLRGQRRQLGKVRRDHRVHLAGQDVRPALGDAGSSELHQEQWVALRLGHEVSDVGVAGGRVDQLMGEHRGGRLVEPVESDLDDGVGDAQLVEHPAERVLASQHVITRRANDQQSTVTSGPDDVVDHGQGVVVAPLQVVDHHDQRSTSARQGASERFAHPGSVRRTRRPGCGDQLGQQPSDLGPPDVVEAFQRTAERRLSKQLDDRAVRRPPLRLVGPGRDTARPTPRRPPDELIHQA